MSEAQPSVGAVHRHPVMVLVAVVIWLAVALA